MQPAGSLDSSEPFHKWCTSSLREGNKSAPTHATQHWRMQRLKTPRERRNITTAAAANAPHDSQNGCAKVHASKAATRAYQRCDILGATRGLAKLGLRRGRPRLLKQCAGLRVSSRSEARGRGHAADAESATGMSPHTLLRAACSARWRAERTTRSRSSDGSEASSDDSLSALGTPLILEVWRLRRRVTGRSPRSTVSGAQHAEASMCP